MSDRRSIQSFNSTQPKGARNSKRTAQYISYACVSGSISLTSRMVLMAIRKMPIEVIYNTVDALIDELDYRHGDPDFEPEPTEDSL